MDSKDKKSKAPNILFDKADLNDERWIKTPFAYTKFCSGLTLLQQDIMYKVSDEIQEFFKPFFAEGRANLSNRPNPLFSREEKEKLRPIRIVLSDYGLYTSNYGDIFRAVKSILGIQLCKPDVNENGEPITRLVNIFTEGHIPRTEKGYTVNNEDGTTTQFDKSKGWVEFRINPDVADYTFDMVQGYINHPRYITRNSGAKNTPQLYGLIKHKCGYGHTAKITVKEIKEHLGLVEMDDKHNIIGYLYPKYSKFRECVLLRVKSDIDRMAECEKIDFTFTFDEIMKRGRKTGEPLYIVFSIHKTALGVSHAKEEKRLEAIRRIISSLTSQYPDINPDTLAQIIKDVDEEDFSDFNRYALKNVPQAIEKKYPEQPANYAFAMLRSWIKDRAVQKNKVEIKDTQQEIPFKTTQQQQFIPGQYAEEWGRVLSIINGPYKEALCATRHIGTIRGFVAVVFKDKSSYLSFQEMEEKDSEYKRQFYNVMQEQLGAAGKILVRDYEKKQ